jgi:hypothetical protein
MADREKVIRAIEVHLEPNTSIGCKDCTYENDGWCMTRVMEDALALLRDPQPPKLVYCPNCGAAVEVVSK